MRVTKLLCMQTMFFSAINAKYKFSDIEISLLGLSDLHVF